MSAAETSPTSSKIISLVDKLRKQYPEIQQACAPGGPGGALATGGAPGCGPCFIDQQEPTLAEFVRSFLIWESTQARAAAAIRKLESSVVDFNELRICLPDELVRMIGRNYPRAEERALRIRAALQDLYARQHSVTLEHLAKMSKREARDFLDSIEGTPRFVSSRVFLVVHGGHAAPVDSRIHRRLIESGVIETEHDVDASAGALEKRVRAGEMMELYALVQAWADELPPPRAAGAAPGSAEPSRGAAAPKDDGRAGRGKVEGRGAKGLAGASTPASGAKAAKDRGQKK